MPARVEHHVPEPQPSAVSNRNVSANYRMAKSPGRKGVAHDAALRACACPQADQCTATSIVENAAAAFASASRRLPSDSAPLSHTRTVTSVQVAPAGSAVESPDNISDKFVTRTQRRFIPRSSVSAVSSATLSVARALTLDMAHIAIWCAPPAPGTSVGARMSPVLWPVWSGHGLATMDRTHTGFAQHPYGGSGKMKEP
jgi:hypothetical protein